MRQNEKQVVATVHRLQLRELRLWVREGWIRPAADERGPIFDELDVARIRLVCDLKKDLALPQHAMLVVLSLLDQVHGLRRELRDLAEAVDRQPDATRKAIINTYRRRTPPQGLTAFRRQWTHHHKPPPVRRSGGWLVFLPSVVSRPSGPVGRG